MKKIKFILPAVVFVFAFAMSFASVKYYDAALQESQYMQKTTNPVQCIQITPVCTGFGDFTCTVVSASNPGGPFVVYGTQVNGTTCTNVLRHHTGIPIQIP